MARTQLTYNEYHEKAISAASEKWPEHMGNINELIRKIIADWFRLTSSSNGRYAKLVEVKEDTEDIRQRVMNMQEILRTYANPDDDVDGSGACKHDYE